MLLTHALTLAEARTYVAALADQALTLDASAAYEQVLQRLDAMYGGDVPALAEIRLDDRDALLTAAESAIEDLIEHGVDALQVELVLAWLEEARDHDLP